MVLPLLVGLVLSNTIRHVQQEISGNFLSSTLPFWLRYSKDTVNGGFYGSVSYNGTPDPKADKGLILNGRLLWGFSYAYRILRDPILLEFANRAQEYLLKHFYDSTNGGYYWLIDAAGNRLAGNDYKSTFGMAFVLYGLAEHYNITQNATSLERARELFGLFEDRYYDSTYRGYFESANRNFTFANPPEKKPNTQIHVLESYVNLRRVWSNATLDAKISELIRLFLVDIIQPNGHMKQETTLNWTVTTEILSWGHDVELSWILLDAAKLVGDAATIESVKAALIKLVDTTVREAVREDGSLPYEWRLEKNDTFRDWWPQIELLNGLFAAFGVKPDHAYVARAAKLWGWVKANMLDYEYGEWFRTVQADGKIEKQAEKIGMWKSCYHTFRLALRAYEAVIEIKPV